MVLYVDDLLIACTDVDEADQIKENLGKHFLVKAFGDTRYVLGMEVLYDREKGELKLRQSQLISRMVDKFGHGDAFALRNPNVIGQDMTPPKVNKKCVNKSQYRAVVGSLLYVANGTRPDICVTVGKLSQYVEDPRELHLRACIRTLRYLKGKSVGITFTRNNSKGCAVSANSDAYWGGDPDTRRSTSGILVLLCGGPVIFKSKKQSTVALSTAESEYMALALTTQEILWLRNLLSEMGLTPRQPIPIYIDKKSAITMASNNGYTPRAKHNDLRYHFVRDHVAKRNVCFHHVPSALQLADFLTTLLPSPQLSELCKMRRLVDTSS